MSEFIVSLEFLFSNSQIWIKKKTLPVARVNDCLQSCICLQYSLRIYKNVIVITEINIVSSIVVDRWIELTHSSVVMKLTNYFSCLAVFAFSCLQVNYYSCV